MNENVKTAADMAEQLNEAAEFFEFEADWIREQVEYHFNNGTPDFWISVESDLARGVYRVEIELGSSMLEEEYDYKSGTETIVDSLIALITRSFREVCHG